MSFHVVPGVKSFERLPSGLGLRNGIMYRECQVLFLQAVLSVRLWSGLLWYIIPFVAFFAKVWKKEEWNKVDYLRK